MKELLADAASTAVLIVILWFLFRKLIEKRLAAAVQLESDKLLATFQAEIDRTAQKLVSVTRAGINASAAHAAAITPTKVAALERIWSCVMNWQKASVLVPIIPAMGEDYILENGDDPRTKRFFKTMLDSIDYIGLLETTGQSELSRPFIRETTWAPFYAFHMFHVNIVAKAATAMTQGSGAVEIWRRLIDRPLIESASTPEILATYDNNRLQGTMDYLSYLRKQILKEIRAELAGEKSTPEALLQAVKIVRLAEELVAEPSPDVQLP